MKILLCFNERYAPHAATLMEELIAQSSAPLSFAVLHVSLSGEVMDKFVHHFSTRVESLEFHRVQQQMVENVMGKSQGTHLPVEAFLRLFAPLFVQDKRVIYLDIDVVCQGDILHLLDEVTDEPLPLWAVTEYDDAVEPQTRKDRSLQALFRPICRRLEMPPAVKYFNTGVMVVNLDVWRKEEITARLLRYIASVDYLRAADQDALNHLLGGRFGVLHPRWNTAASISGRMSGYSPEELRQALTPPMAHHIQGSQCKQWSWLNYPRHYTKLYWKYRRLTPWPATRPNESPRKVLSDLYGLNVPDSIRKHVRAAKRRLGITATLAP